MTKAKKSLITGASVVGLACCMAGSLLCTTGIAASAASDFAANSESGAVFLGGQPEANVLAALNAKVAEIKMCIRDRVNIKPGRKQVSVKRRDEMFMNPLFLELWNKMKQKTIYRINMDKCNNSLCQEVRNRKSNC